MTPERTEPPLSATLDAPGPQTVSEDAQAAQVPTPGEPIRGWRLLTHGERLIHDGSRYHAVVNIVQALAAALDGLATCESEFLTRKEHGRLHCLLCDRYAEAGPVEHGDCPFAPLNGRPR